MDNDPVWVGPHPTGIGVGAEPGVNRGQGGFIILVLEIGYNGFLDVYDEYRTQLLMKKQLGKLESIIDPERKREKRREYEQGRSGEVG